MSEMPVLIAGCFGNVVLIVKTKYEAANNSEVLISLYKVYNIKKKKALIVSKSLYNQSFEFCEISLFRHAVIKYSHGFRVIVAVNVLT